jgi:hypothetical protein
MIEQTIKNGSISLRYDMDSDSIEMFVDTGGRGVTAQLTAKQARELARVFERLGNYADEIHAMKHNHRVMNDKLKQ